MLQNLAAINIATAGLLAVAVLNLTAPGRHYLVGMLLAHAAAALLRYAVLTENLALMLYGPLVAFPLLFAVGPFWYGYVCRALFDSPLKGWRAALSLIAPVVALVTHVVFLLLFGRDYLVGRFASLPFNDPYGVGVIVVASAYCAAWAIATFGRIFRYRSEYEKSHSGDARMKTQWFQALLIAHVLSWLFVFAVAAVRVLWLGLAPFTILGDVLLLLLLFFFVYYLITRPVPTAIEPPIDPPIEPLKEPPIELPIEEPRYRRAGLSAEDRQRLVSELEEHMRQEQAYLDEELSLQSLAQELEVSRHHLSLVLNLDLGRNFYQYVNGYRIAHARELLLAEPQRSVLEVAFESGFQTKASLNRAFKSQCGLTPGEFRRNNQDRPTG